MHVDVLLIAYKNLAQTKACASVVEETGGKLVNKVYIHDNTERNENIHKLWNKYLHLSDRSYFCTMNPDTKPEPMWLYRMLDLMQNNPYIAAVGPSTDNCYNEQSGRHPEIVGQARGSWLPHALIPGFCALYRRSALLQLGGWRESFKFYGGDLDMAYRLQLAGWETAWCIPAFVWHEWGGSAKKLGDDAYNELRRIGNLQFQSAVREYGGISGAWVHLGEGKMERKKDGQAEQVEGEEDAQREPSTGQEVNQKAEGVVRPHRRRGHPHQDKKEEKELTT
jgi:hypothetical protein